MKYLLIKLSKYLLKESLEQEAEEVQKLWEGSENIEEDWDIEEEAKQLRTPTESEKDKQLRETYPGTGWHLPDKGFGWLMDIINTFTRTNDFASDSDLYNREDIPESLEKAIVTMGDGMTREYIGHGTWGVAIDIGNNKVLKIFNSKSQQIFEDKDKVVLTRDMMFKQSPYASDEVMIFASGVFQSADLGWKIMEKLITKNSDELFDYRWELTDLIQLIVREAIKHMKGGFDLFSEKRSDQGKYLWQIRESVFDNLFSKTKTPDGTSDLVRKKLRDPQTGEAINHIADLVEKGVKTNNRYNHSEAEEKMKKTLDLDEDWLRKFITHMIVQIISGREDLHSGNFGFRPSTGTFAFFDA
jgi:hypothetical protein